MKLEELIQKRFTEREGLTKFLAKFGDYPEIGRASCRERV